MRWIGAGLMACVIALAYVLGREFEKRRVQRIQRKWGTPFFYKSVDVGGVWETWGVIAKERMKK